MLSLLINYSTTGGSGRTDLFHLAGELKNKGAVTILAGPQANVDFKGETDHDRFNHRFKGMSDRFVFAMQGPAEATLPRLDRIMELAEEGNLELSQINLTLRADYFLKGLKNLNKGVTRQMNLNTNKMIRDLKPKIPFSFWIS